MSTFNGIVSEFPEIRIDFFRRQLDQLPPLACFLSHIHSDHLAGLDTLRSPFVYCSAATREILLRLERYTCRINYVRGILEARQQTYKHLRKVLKALPLEAPTVIELRHGHNIQVTLFDANHCPGSTMFLIEGQGKAILYTGDIRAEPWFVNSIARNPTILEYTCGFKKLDKLYLDTSFLEDIPFQTKAEGIADLLAKVRRYPDDTIFHLQAWTFGYEDVWIALSKALNSRVHVDDYKLRIFQSLKNRTSDQPFASEFHLTNSAAVLAGHMCGNTQHPGCLTSDPNVRIHSCEKANMCSVARLPSVVSIRPVVCRLPDGDTIMEAGVGGGGTDFSREAELNWITDDDIDTLVESLPAWKEIDNETKYEIKNILSSMASSGRDLSLKMDIKDFGEDLSTDVGSVIKSLTERLSNKPETPQPTHSDRPDGLPKVILFPFARHSPYRELRHLVELFKPKDIWPCTTDEQWVDGTMSVESLFGEYCSEQIFEHDKQMATFLEQLSDARPREAKSPGFETQETNGCDTSVEISPKMNRTRDNGNNAPSQLGSPSAEEVSTQASLSICIPSSEVPETSVPIEPTTTRDIGQSPVPIPRYDLRGSYGSSQARGRLDQELDTRDEQVQDQNETDSQMTDVSSESTVYPESSIMRYEAYNTMIHNARGNDPWRPIYLVSTNGNYEQTDAEL